MGLSKSNRHKRTKTGAKRTTYCKKRKFNLARLPTNTKIGPTRIQTVRVRGGSKKFRALRINHGNFACRSEHFVVPAKISQVLYHPSNNELMRTNTVTKGVVVKLDLEKPEELKKFDCLKEKDENFFSNLEKGKLYGLVASRPGQCGRADGYILQGDELDFYLNKLKRKNK